MNKVPIERSPRHIKLKFRKLNPNLGMSSEKVLIELFDTFNEELVALYLPHQDFQYGDYLYFALASHEYLHNGPLPLFLKLEFRPHSYERKSLPFTEGLSKAYPTMEVLLAHSYVSDSATDIFLEVDDLEKWEYLGVGI